MLTCEAQYFVMQNEQKSLSFVHVCGCGILVDECLSHSVLWFSHRGLSEQLKGAFQSVSTA